MLPSKQHTRSPSQEPHEPPQPSVPQIFSERSSPQSGVQHEPAKHISPWAVLHDPQSTPPVPVPHQRPSQPFGRQVPDSQNLSAAHSPQVPPQPSSPHSIPAHCCLQHWPSAHLKPASHLPQPSGRPQLSSPHFAEPQTGTQHVPAMQGSPSPHCPHCPHNRHPRTQARRSWGCSTCQGMSCHPGNFRMFRHPSSRTHAPGRTDPAGAVKTYLGGCSIVAGIPGINT